MPLTAGMTYYHQDASQISSVSVEKNNIFQNRITMPAFQSNAEKGLLPQWHRQATVPYNNGTVPTYQQQSSYQGIQQQFQQQPLQIFLSPQDLRRFRCQQQALLLQQHQQQQLQQHLQQLQQTLLQQQTQLQQAQLQQQNPEQLQQAQLQQQIPTQLQQSQVPLLQQLQQQDQQLKQHVLSQDLSAGTPTKESTEKLLHAIFQEHEKTGEKTNNLAGASEESNVQNEIKKEEAEEESSISVSRRRKKQRKIDFIDLTEIPDDDRLHAEQIKEETTSVLDDEKFIQYQELNNNVVKTSSVSQISTSCDNVSSCESLPKNMEDTEKKDNVHVTVMDGNDEKNIRSFNSIESELLSNIADSVFSTKEAGSTKTQLPNAASAERLPSSSNSFEKNETLSGSKIIEEKADQNSKSETLSVTNIDDFQKQAKSKEPSPASLLRRRSSSGGEMSDSKELTKANSRRNESSAPSAISRKMSDKKTSSSDDAKFQKSSKASISPHDKLNLGMKKIKLMQAKAKRDRTKKKQKQSLKQPSKTFESKECPRKNNTSCVKSRKPNLKRLSSSILDDDDSDVNENEASQPTRMRLLSRLELPPTQPSKTFDAVSESKECPRTNNISCVKSRKPNLKRLSSSILDDDDSDDNENEVSQPTKMRLLSQPKLPRTIPKDPCESSSVTKTTELADDFSRNFLGVFKAFFYEIN